MAVKTALVTLESDGLRFRAAAGSGHEIVLDDDRGDAGMRPSELLPVALAGCTGMDVISILRKQRQPVSAYRIEVRGTQRESTPAAYEAFEVVHVVEGAGVEVGAVRRAIELSAERYCSVGATLASGSLTIRHGYRVVDPGTGAEVAGDVLTEGPRREPGAAGEA